VLKQRSSCGLGRLSHVEEPHSRPSCALPTACVALAACAGTRPAKCASVLLGSNPGLLSETSFLSSSLELMGMFKWTAGVLELASSRVMALCPLADCFPLCKGL
jgi:hypothetical protein